MIIGKPLFSPSFSKAVLFKEIKISDKNPSNERKQTIREAVQAKISDIQEAQTNMGEDKVNT